MKPKPKAISQPAYTSSAREANVEGKVRVEVSVGGEVLGMGVGRSRRVAETAAAAEAVEVLAARSRDARDATETPARAALADSVR